ncbi:MAG: hypothetical protein EA353_08125 [Puniceicoccaceae bacterium]|nr:MAG: hypothetical protein EA353_08125 [Puniceicoccaceae bacterium]
MDEALTGSFGRSDKTGLAGNRTTEGERSGTRRIFQHKKALRRLLSYAGHSCSQLSRFTWLRHA